MSTNDTLIYHIFADTGVESEVLDAYGRVVRVGWDPIDTGNSEPVKADARHLPLRPNADLALLHPPCQAYSSATHGTGDPTTHPELIEAAREIGREYADHYILENVPQAPLLKDESVKLNGKMFGMPITYTRKFETSFYVEQPTEYADLRPESGPMAKQGSTGNMWIGTEEWWRSAKMITGDYPVREMKRHGIPAPYIQYLIRHWLRATGRSGGETTAKTSGGVSGD